jgi:cytochrome c oxidase subunit 2
VRESIVNPQAKVVAGFQPIMPTFQGLVSEEQLLQLIAYVRSLNAQPGSPASPAPASPTMPQSSDRPAREPGK